METICQLVTFCADERSLCPVYTTVQILRGNTGQLSRKQFRQLGDTELPKGGLLAVVFS
jgi:hypothetical protein